MHYPNCDPIATRRKTKRHASIWASAVAILFAACAAPARAGPLVAGIYVRPAECTAEMLDLLRDLGLNDDRSHLGVISSPRYQPTTFAPEDDFRPGSRFQTSAHD
jgi:hypothetical protein